MPAGHAARASENAIGQTATDLFVNDFVTDLMPYVEKHYRVLTDRANTPIAGLSMGGSLQAARVFAGFHESPGGHTLRRVACATASGRPKTRDTVAVDTPARLATS